MSLAVLPAGWASTSAGDICRVASGVGFPIHLQGKDSGDLPFFKVGDISKTWLSGRIYLGPAQHYISSSEAESLRATPIPSGSTVFAKIGAAIALNRRAIIEQPSLVDNNVMALIPDQRTIIAAYLFHFMRTVLLGDLSQATTVPSVRASDVSRIQLPLPPLAEQKRIVAKIDDLTARSRRAREALDAIPPLLERFRQSVLAAAFRGDLTAGWRTANPIGNAVRVPSRPGKSSSPQRSLGDLRQLPPEWAWVRMSDIADVQLGRQRSPEHHSGPNMKPYLRAANVTWNGLDLSDVKHMNFEASDFARHSLRPGDILVTEASGSRYEVGKTAIWAGEIADCCCQNTLIRVRCVEHQHARFVYQYLMQCAISGSLGKAATGIGIFHLGKQSLANWPIPMPPQQEQNEIVVAIDEALRNLKAIESCVTSTQALHECLAKSILAKAFRGELVPQDPNDEPASVLLERIRAEREPSGRQRESRGRKYGVT